MDFREDAGLRNSEKNTQDFILLVAFFLKFQNKRPQQFYRGEIKY